VRRTSEIRSGTVAGALAEEAVPMRAQYVLNAGLRLVCHPARSGV
jgi:hypothetical protein